MALLGSGEFKAGNWCRFCKARNQCRARAEQFLELAKMELNLSHRLFYQMMRFQRY